MISITLSKKENIASLLSHLENKFQEQLNLDSFTKLITEKDDQVEMGNEDFKLKLTRDTLSCTLTKKNQTIQIPTNKVREYLKSKKTN
jgi:hypothetical protein